MSEVTHFESLIR